MEKKHRDSALGYPGPRGRFRSQAVDIELALEQTEIRRLGGLQRSAGIVRG